MQYTVTLRFLSFDSCGLQSGQCWWSSNVGIYIDSTARVYDPLSSRGRCEHVIWKVFVSFVTVSNRTTMRLMYQSYRISIWLTNASAAKIWLLQQHAAAGSHFERECGWSRGERIISLILFVSFFSCTSSCCIIVHWFQISFNSLFCRHVPELPVYFLMYWRTIRCVRKG